MGTGAASTVNEAELFDIKQVAKDRGIPLAQAIKELAGQDEFAAFATEAAERFPDEFSFARYDSGAASLGVKGTLSTSMTQLARALPFDVSVAQNVGWSEREIKAAGEAVHAAARAAAPGVSISTDIDTRTGQVTVATSAAASGARVSPTVLAGSDAVRAAGARLPAGAKLTFISDTGEGGLDTVYGGGSLSTCTAAFSVSSPSYAHGLLTAEHCGNSQAYSGRSVLTFRAALSKSLGDAQWHSSSEGANPYFYYTSGSLRAITSTANAVPGQSLCKYGKTTSNTCDTVYKTAQCRDAYCNLIMGEPPQGR
ncbi:hypothetical protein [Nostocoides sp. Soil756]|uniref:hypothetical protein n=1 Tax=Nostocoides sp. Soil756 TaxID=1736399 RepID=UPI0012FC3629|nr:hypothetical protein [Tetrasphaera sp. Soil756]